MVYSVENKLKDKLKAKYSNIIFNGTEFQLGSIKIQIDLKIAGELNYSEEEIKNTFRNLCVHYLKTCHDNEIPLVKRDIVVFLEPEINRGLSTLVQMEDDSISGYIWIPPIDLKLPLPFLEFTFSHELGHCWLNLRFEDIETNETVTDLVAAVALSKLIHSYSRMYKDIIKTRSYFHNGAKEIYRQVLQDPESYLKNVLTKWKCVK